jgi:hypothetical protein
MAQLTKNLFEYAFQRAMDAAHSSAVSGGAEKHCVEAAVSVMKAAKAAAELVEYGAPMVADKLIVK